MHSTRCSRASPLSIDGSPSPPNAPAAAQAGLSAVSTLSHQPRQRHRRAIMPAAPFQPVKKETFPTSFGTCRSGPTIAGTCRRTAQSATRAAHLEPWQSRPGGSAPGQRPDPTHSSTTGSGTDRQGAPARIATEDATAALFCRLPLLLFQGLQPKGKPSTTEPSLANPDLAAKMVDDLVADR